MLQQALHTSLFRLYMLTGICFLITGNLFAQSDSNNMKYWLNNSNNYRLYSDSITLYFFKNSVCRSQTLDSLSFVLPKVGVFTEKMVGPISKPDSPIPFLQVHGNIAYTFDYRSQLDTPFTATNLQQHNEQVFANATLKGKYPFKLILNSRQSNSPYFKNYTDLSIQFNHQAYEQEIKQKMISEITKQMHLPDSVKKYDLLIKQQKAEYSILKDWIESPARMQEIVQQKEEVYGKYMKFEKENMEVMPMLKSSIISKKDSIILPANLKLENINTGDSLLAMLQWPTETEKKIKAKEKVLDSLYKKILYTQHYADSVKSAIGEDISSQINKVRNAGSIKELQSLCKKSGINNLGKTDKNILSVTQFGIGRTSVNYSDLTVSNISLSGLNIEFNPSYYVAFAAGSVNYLFRDFIIKPGYMPKQNLVLGRIGFGDKEKRIFIFTVYNGTKNNFGGSVSDTSSQIPVITTNNIFGYSVEGKYKVSQNIDASIEFAKSSARYRNFADKARSFERAFTFSDRLNEAWSAKVNISIPQLRSSVNLFYKQIGPDFQSYSIYNSGISQEAWGVKLRQYLFRNKLSLTAQVKKSSLGDPLIPIDYNSSIVFKSFQAVYRKKKWPVFSLGYMPCTQLIKSPAGYFSQSVYYALTTGIFYSYKLSKLPMYSNLMYNKFYNKGTDTGFVLYNAKNILYTHNIDFGSLSSQSEVQYISQPGLAYWTFQQRVDLQIGKSVNIGIGLKNNIVPVGNISLWGGSAQIGIRLKESGALRLQFDKGYLSNGLGKLVPNNWGRAMWNKVF